MNVHLGDLKTFSNPSLIYSPFSILMYELDVKSCGLMIGLLRMCEVMGLHMYIALVDFVLDYE